jgi:CheY-like chemotaxis protein
MVLAQCVLVTEDNEEVSQALRELIHSVNHEIQVVTVPTADAAIQCLSADPGKFALLLVNFNLGAIQTGKAVWDWHQRRCPELPFYFMSAMREDHVYRDFGPGENKPPFLSKPFDIDECLQILEGVLGAQKVGIKE